MPSPSEPECVFCQIASGGGEASIVYEDEIVITGDDAKFKSKRAVIDTLVTPRYIVYPV